MSVNVIVAGLPGEMKFNRLVFSFKGLLKKINLRKFWIRELSDMYHGNKQMTVEFPSIAEARKACNYLDNLPFVYGQTEYQLAAHVDEGSEMVEEYPHNPQEQREWGRSRKPEKRGRQRPRSPSPEYSKTASKLDMEIELLRKQRQVIEEERKLLLEQKKLEMIREFGPTADRDFDFEQYEGPRKRQKQPLVPGEAKKPRKRSPPPKVPRAAPTGLPAFFQPCKKLIAQMMPLIEKDTSAEEKDILIKLIRAAIRKNIAIALDGKGFTPAAQILKLYRELHPESTDEAFVAKILGNIRASYLPAQLAGKPTSEKTGNTKPKVNETADNNAKDINGENNSDEKSEDDKVAETSEGKEVKREPGTEESANAENEDAEPKNVGDEVKPEPVLTEDNETVPNDKDVIETPETNETVPNDKDVIETSETPVSSEAAEL